MQGLCTSSSYSGFRALLEQTPEFPAALSQALQKLAHYSSRVRNILVSHPADFRVATEACNECIVRPPPNPHRFLTFARPRHPRHPHALASPPTP